MILSYRENLRLLRNPSFENILAIARNFIPAEDKDFFQLTNPPLSEPSQNMLIDLYRYGPVRKAKIDRTLETIPRKVFQDDVFEIIDWECGQGLNTVCFFDFLRKNGIENRVKKITLIESSQEALERAFWHISPFIDDTDRIHSVCKPISEIKKKDIESRQPITFHFFTDVFDNPTLDLKRIAELVGYGIHGKHYFFCVGTLNQNNRRIDAFYNYFDSPETFADEELFPNTKQEYGIKIKAFKLENSNFNLKYVNYYPAVQHNAAYRLDSVKKALKTVDSEKVEALYRSLSRFETYAYYDLGACTHEHTHPLLAILNNIVTRGMPAQASPFIEEVFASLGNGRQKNNPEIIEYDTRRLDAEDLFAALHIIDPRLKLDETNYNCKLLESEAEKTFITRMAPQPLRQLMQSQRNLYSLTRQKAYHTQRINFAFEFPYPSKDEKNIRHDGCAIEINEKLHHSTMEQKRADKQRADDLAAINWYCRQIPEEEMSDSHFEYLGSEYVKTVFDVFERPLDKDRVRILQYALSPIAIARIQKVILEAVISRRLDIGQDKWSVLVMERDLPCAAVAFADMKQLYNHLTALSSEYSGLKFPEVELTIVSSREFINSPLHLEIRPILEITEEQRKKTFDLIIDISVLRRADIENISFAGFINCKNKCSFHVRSSHYRRDTRRIYTSGRITYSPLTKKNIQEQYETLTKTSEHLRYFLQLLFRKENFVSGQLPVLDRILQNRCTVGLIPANDGKSTVWKLAAMLQPGITTVVVPTDDTAKTLNDEINDTDIDIVTCLHGGLNGREKEKREQQIESSEKLIVILSSEQSGRQSLRQRFRYMEKTSVYFAHGIIDEVQGLSEWSPDFRPSYILIAQALHQYTLPQKGSITVAGLTEKASMDMLADIEQALSSTDEFSTDKDRIVLCKNTALPDSIFKKESYLRNFYGFEEESEYIIHLICHANITYLEGGHTMQASGCYFPLTLESMTDKPIIYLPYPDTKNEEKDLAAQKNRMQMLHTKALYRMYCIGLIEDITHDDTRQKSRIVMRKRPAGGYYRQLRNFFLRYYTKKRAEQEMIKAQNYPLKITFPDNIREELCKSLTYITAFVESQISKRQQVTEKATDKVRISDLAKDTENGIYSSQEILFRYMHLIKDEETECDSPNSRVKELHETVRTLRRSFSGSNPALSLLNAFCLFYRGTGGKEMYEYDLRKSYEDGMVGFYRTMPDTSDFRELFEAYNCYIRGETDYFADTRDWTEEIRAHIDIIRAADILNLHLAQTKILQHKYLEKWK